MGNHVYPGIVSGPPEYECYVRAHQNTLEHLALFLPGLGLFSVAVDPLWAAGIGMLWPIGSVWYALGYTTAPAKRIPGLLMSMPPIYIFVIDRGAKAFLLSTLSPSKPSATPTSTG